VLLNIYVDVSGGNLLHMAKKENKRDGAALTFSVHLIATQRSRGYRVDMGVQNYLPKCIYHARSCYPYCMIQDVLASRKERKSNLVPDGLQSPRCNMEMELGFVQTVGAMY
jgi:hypothetical protein